MSTGIPSLGKLGAIFRSVMQLVLGKLGQELDQLLRRPELRADEAAAIRNVDKQDRAESWAMDLQHPDRADHFCRLLEPRSRQWDPVDEDLGEKLERSYEPPAVAIEPVADRS